MPFRAVASQGRILYSPFNSSRSVDPGMLPNLLMPWSLLLQTCPFVAYVHFALRGKATTPHGNGVERQLIITIRQQYH